MGGQTLPSVRSYSMNCFMGGRDPNVGPVPLSSSGFTPFFTKESDLPRTSDLWVFVEEDERSINDGFFITDPTAHIWFDFPANSAPRHTTAIRWPLPTAMPIRGVTLIRAAWPGLGPGTRGLRQQRPGAPGPSHDHFPVGAGPACKGRGRVKRYRCVGRTFSCPRAGGAGLMTQILGHGLAPRVDMELAVDALDMRREPYQC